MNIEDKLVRVEWVNSSTASSWTLLEDFKEEQHDPIKIVSYGIIVKETDDYLIIAQNYGSNPPQICNTTAIPKGCIIKQEIIKSEDKMEAVIDKNTYTIKNTPNCAISVYNEKSKESEDERIKGAIIDYLKDSNLTGWATWLEKQGKPFDDNIITRDDEILQAISIGLTDVEKDLGWSDFGGLPIEEIQDWLEKQGEKKELRKIENSPILSNSAKTGKNWSDEDEELLQHCCGAVAAADYYTLEDKEEMENWLKSIKKRMEE